MKNPVLSFFVALVIWLFFLAFFSAVIFKESQMPPISLEVDASMVGSFEQEKKTAPKEVAKKTLEEKSATEKTEEKEVKSEAKKAAPIFNPLPKIPDDLRAEAFESEAVAFFYIAADGLVSKVELIKPCANPRLNALLLKSLRSWKFPATTQGSTQEIRVNFRVE